MISPPDEATARPRGAPCADSLVPIIAGMVIAPVEATLAEAEPDIDPNRAEETTATFCCAAAQTARRRRQQVHEALSGLCPAFAEPRQRSQRSTPRRPTTPVNLSENAALGQCQACPSALQPAKAACPNSPGTYCPNAA